MKVEIQSFCFTSYFLFIYSFVHSMKGEGRILPQSQSDRIMGTYVCPSYTETPWEVNLGLSHVTSASYGALSYCCATTAGLTVTFHVPNGHMWLIASVLDSTDKNISVITVCFLSTTLEASQFRN